MRVHKDCKVYVSANSDIPTEKVDDFVVSKGAYIRSAQRKFREMAQYAPQPKKYVSGETFYLLGRGVRLKVEKNVQDAIWRDYFGNLSSIPKIWSTYADITDS